MSTRASMPYGPEHFDAMFSASDDPWHFETRWYESRKRELTLAALPAPRFGSAYEPGCANAELSLALAPRCGRLLISDGSLRAVQLARERSAHLGHVEVRHAWTPEEWPEEQFDLIVLSEVAYYLDEAALDLLAERILASMLPNAALLACHWRERIGGCAMSGDEVHRHLADRLALPHLVGYIDDDLRLDVWSLDCRSVAEREGFKSARS